MIAVLKFLSTNSVISILWVFFFFFGLSLHYGIFFFVVVFIDL